MPTESLPATLRLSPDARAFVVRASEAARPEEACGLLIGRRGEGAADTVEVRAASAARNLEAGCTDRFELHPGDLVAAEDAARAEGLEVVGVWHSHPTTPALPSEGDRRGAWGGWLHLIVSLAGDGPELRAWRLEGERFVEVGEVNG